MSMYLEFEPHSWYRGFAIKRTANQDYDKWRAYTDDGMTYQIIELSADTLTELKQKITNYRKREADRMARLYASVEDNHNA